MSLFGTVAAFKDRWGADFASRHTPGEGDADAAIDEALQQASGLCAARLKLQTRPANGEIAKAIDSMALAIAAGDLAPTFEPATEAKAAAVRQLRDLSKSPLSPTSASIGPKIAFKGDPRGFPFLSGGNIT